MKKFLMLFVLLVSLVGFSACKSDDDGNGDDGANNSSSQIASVVSTLEGDGYVLEEHDADTRAYRETRLSEDYGLTVSVEAFYIGYVNTTERWAQVHAFSSSTEAQSYYDALDADVDNTALIALVSNVVIETSSQDTIDLFD